MSLLQGTLASLRPAVVSMIAKAGVTILISAFFIDGTVNLIRQNVCVEMIIFFVIALVLLRKFKINPDRKSTRLNSSHSAKSRMPSSA